MESTTEDKSRTTEINTRHAILSVLFSEDGKQVVGGGTEGVLHRWRVDDGQEVGKPIQFEGEEISAVTLSRNGKWLVCGLCNPKVTTGARIAVLDAQTPQEVLVIHTHTACVHSVDMSPDSTQFAIGTSDKHASIYSITTGERLVGPLMHSELVVAVQFSPNGGHIATVASGRRSSIRIYHSENGRLVLEIPFRTIISPSSSPLAWSADSRQLFTTFLGEVNCFDASSGTLLSKWLIPGGSLSSIVLAHNQKFAVVTGACSMSFWDICTYRRIGTVIKQASDIWSVMLSPNDDYIVTGTKNGIITIQNLLGVIPSSYFATGVKIQDDTIPSLLRITINEAIRNVLRASPLVLIDVKSGRPCDVPERIYLFESDPEYNELVSSMTKKLDERYIQKVVEEYFRYVMLSHVWQGQEPSFRDLKQAGSVWKLVPSPLNDKLREFCEAVRSDGYRWAWSDTCCIDKTISTVLVQSLRMMYRWYEASAATFVLLADVDSTSGPGGLKRSRWLTRAWTSQELLAPKVLRFYTRDWRPYLGDTRSNHKESPEIMQELTDSIGISCDLIRFFNPDHLSNRTKLRLASTRQATLEEDIAYSLIGIFSSDIRPSYGEGDIALGHLLEETVNRSGDVTVLAWNGESSSYNSCLPASLAMYSQPYCSAPPITGMDERVAELRSLISQADIIHVYSRIACLPHVKFGNRRLHLPCIIFTVRRLNIPSSASGLENRYRARVSGIGDVEFQTSDRLLLAEPRKLIFVHPWIQDLCDPLNDDDSDSRTATNSAPPSLLHAVPTATMDDYTRALRLVVRLQEPFQALLLQQQSHGGFKRVAAEHGITVPGIKRLNNFARDVRTGVVEVL